MSDNFLKVVVSAAATIWERLDWPTPSDVDRDLGMGRLVAWCQSSASGDAALFEQRLSRDGLEQEHVVTALGSASYSGSPEWAHTAAWIEQALRRGLPAQSCQTERCMIAFSDLFQDLVEEAGARLDQRVGPPSPALLSDPASAALRVELARSVSDLCAPVLYEHFCRFQSGNSEATATSEVDVAYKNFVHHMQSVGFRAVFRERPVLLRLLSIIVDQWLTSTAEFIGRLAEDRNAVAGLSGVPATSAVAGSEIVGDLHNHGRAVRRVDFDGGKSVFYKPKDLEIDGAWFELIQDLNDQSPPFALRVPNTVRRSGYGWAESVEHDPCGDPRSFDSYFRRAGGWLCLLQMFGATDMHEENIIAAGDQPVPVDLETLLQPAPTPDVAKDDPRRAYSIAGAEIANSVLATGLLPAYGRRPGGDAIAHGGLLETRTPQRVVQWADVNTDLMRPVAAWVAGAPNKNRPHVAGTYADIKDHSDAVATGYAEYAAFLLSQVQSRGIATLTEKFADIRVRKLTKNTRFYSLLVDRLRDPRNMADGALWSANLDVVSRFSDWSEASDPWWPLVGAERAALSELNIPHFTMPAAGSTILDVDGVAAESGLQSGLDRVRSLLGSLSPTEIIRQTEIVQLSLTTVRSVEASLGLRQRRRATTAFKPTPDDPTHRFQQSASVIASQLARTAHRGERSAVWVGLDWLQDSTVCQLAPLGVGLYNGVVGVSLFLAAHSKISGSPESARLALDGLAALRHDLLGPDAHRSARALGIGAASGLGSVLYGMTAIAQLIGEATLLSDALRISALIPDPLAAPEVALDIMEGKAGAVLGLLKLYRATGRQDILRQAEALGRGLLPPAEPNHLLRTGLSHGPAGVALALAGLARELPDQTATELLGASEHWVSAENREFCSLHRGWPDGRVEAPDSEAFWPCQWCHGAAGIGLSRISIAAALRSDSDQLRFRATIDRDVERAVEATKAAWPYATDSLCCGSLGGIELLSEAARYRNAPGLRTLAQTRLCETLDEAEAAGEFLWDIADSSVNVGLFRGVSGMGYVLLRQVEPSLPNILVWE